MATNEWINGYLEAILDAGSRKSDLKGNSNIEDRSNNNIEVVKFEENLSSHQNNYENKEAKDLKPFNPTQYFVEEVVNCLDESDLYKTWVKVIATRNTRERSNRLENMCWRIWHLARKKKQIALDGELKLSKRQIEREEGRHDAALDDLAELSEGEKEKSDINKAEILTEKIPPTLDPDIYLSRDENNPTRLYIVLISLHGLVRGENMELGRDSDTGGQVKYVVELARALANMEGVFRVDLLTRQITSLEVDSSYGEPIEMLSYPSDGCGGLGAYLVRIPCGPRDKYIPKESLWPYIPEFVDGALSHVVNMARALGEQVDGTKPIWPYVIHGHYADAGEAAALLSGALNVPMVLTGHSLGRNKFEQLLKQGRLTKEDINSTYKIMRRIEGEELALDAAAMVVTSTRQEIDEQWGLYDGFDIKLERNLRARKRRGVSTLGRNMARMVVIPPGMDFSHVLAQDTLEGDADIKSLIGSDRTQNKRNIPPIWSEIMRFFTNPHKPMILALSRPDPKKNVRTLLKAFGECKPLRELGNLTLILGNRDDIEEMPTSSSVELISVLKLIDKYDLYGHVAIPKHHKQSDVPEIYRLATKMKGVFINPALVEPFGLTLIEAAAYGLPIVATKNGGPVDIIKALNNGILIDPHDQKAIADALLKLVADKNLWLECRKNGLKNIHRFSWPEHCRNYLSHVEHCRNRHPTTIRQVGPIIEEPMSDSLRGIEDLSLKFSMDLDFKAVGDTDVANRQTKLIEALTHRASSGSFSNNLYSPGRRQGIFIIATDCYNKDGFYTERLPQVIKNVMQAAISNAGQIGFVLSTGSTFSETKELLERSHIKLEDFDALVCNSGSEMYFPWKDSAADQDYEAHIGYRWSGDNVKSTIVRLVKLPNGEDNDVVECADVFSSHCHSYNIKPGSKTRKVDELRQNLRMRGFRCNTVYSHATSRLNVVPLFASRAQAIRYLSVRWGIDLSKMVVFVGESGDTDYEELLVGLHKTVILAKTVEYGSENVLRSEENFKRTDFVPQDSPNIAFGQSPEVDDISAALKTLYSV